MDLQEWREKLAWMSNEQLIQAHFGLQEQIKKHYKLRDVGNNLKKSHQPVRATNSNVANGNESHEGGASSKLGGN